MEDEARLQGRSLADMTLQEMDGLWDEIKRRDRDASLKSEATGQSPVSGVKSGGTGPGAKSDASEVNSEQKQQD